MGNSSFFNTPVAYDVVQEGGEGSSFYGGPAYTQIDPVAIADSVAQAAAAAAASEASHQASQASADASASSAAAAHTIELNAASSASAAAGSATAAAGSASAASDSATTATTQAGIATTQAGNAATLASAAAASASNAATSATSASGSATTATTQAGNASTSATNAATSATNAAASLAAMSPSSATPLMNGPAAAGSSTNYARGDHVHPTDTSRAPTASPSFTGTPTAPTAPLGTNTTQIATTAFVLGSSTVLRGWISGLGMAWVSGTSMLVNAGLAADSTNSGYMIGTTMSKGLGSFVAGAGNGALDTGSVAANTWYHWFVIKNTGTSAVDYLYSLNASVPTMPSGFSLFRRIGSAKTNASSQWTKFIQDGDRFMWDAPVADVTSTGAGNTSAILRTLSVPTSVRVCALVSCGFNAAAANTDLPAGIYLSDPFVSDQVPNVGSFMSFELYMSTTSGSVASGGQVSCMTNTSAQIRSRLQISTSGTTFYILTNGWIDTRGKDV